MVVGARSVGASIRKTTALVDYQGGNRVSALGLWSSQTTEFLHWKENCQSCPVQQNNNNASLIKEQCNINQGTTTNVSERTVRRTLHRICYWSRRSAWKSAFTTVFYCLPWAERTSPVCKEVPGLESRWLEKGHVVRWIAFSTTPWRLQVTNVEKTIRKHRPQLHCHITSSW